MPAKVTEHATDYEEIDRFEGGVGWIAHPGETMERASHALATERGIYLVDPVDAEGVDELVAEFGDVVGVVLLSNHHSRDADVFARRHDVPVYLPAKMDEVESDLGAPIEWFDHELPGSDYELLAVAVGSGWQEFALWDGETLVVSESLGTADYIRVDGEPLGVMTLRRLVPPREALGDLRPERILVGHGAGVHEHAPAALDRALRTSRRKFPRALWENGRKQASTVLAALRS